MKSRISTKNSLLYKMKCLNTKNEEYVPLNDNSISRTERYSDYTIKK